MSRRPILQIVAIAASAALLVTALAVPATGDTWETCHANASVRLYADEAHNTLVDAFSVTGAPTQHRIGSGFYVVKGEQGRPGVDVIGSVTGTSYVFWFRTDSLSQSPGDVAIRNVSMDWRVTAPGDGVISDSRYRKLRVYHEGDAVVYKVFGPVIHGLWLSGNMGIYCP